MNSFILNYLEKSFLDLCSKVHVRFELGEPFANGTDARLDQVNYRAKEIFNEIFDGEDKIYVMIKDWMHEVDVMFGNTTPLYVYELLDKKVLDEGIFSYEDEDLDDEGITIIREVPYKITLAYDKVNDIPYANILKGISYYEQGREPSIGQAVYFICIEKNILFHMYDDRGCIVFGVKPGDLRNIYDRYNDWIVEYWRDSIDAIFEHE